MAKTDNPLKRLFSDFSTDFGFCKLGDQVSSVRPTNIALLPSEEEIRADEIFDVTLTDGRVLNLHIDFQGVRSHRPMPWRVLDYISRIAETYHRDVCTVVIYVGNGAGSNDKGRHQVKCSDGKVILSWRYRVIHLWKMKAEKLLKLNRPALLALIGQTQIDDPKKLLPQVVKRLRAVADDEMRGRLFTALLALMNDKEMIDMIERMIARDNLLLDTPYIRRWREEGFKDGLEEGFEDGLEKGLEKGLKKGRTEGSVSARHRDLLDVLMLRFEPSLPFYQEIEEGLSTITNEKNLKTLLTTAVQSEDLTAFKNVMDNL
jgi:predicted transposase YdaD